MSDNIELPKEPGKGKVYAGLILLTIGVIFLFRQLDLFFFPGWLFGWPMWLIIWGLFIGARHNFRNSSWLIMVIIGSAFLLNDALPDYNVHAVVWPLGIIIFGVWLILRRNHTWENDSWGKKWENKWEKKWNKYDHRNGNPFEPVITPVTPVEEVPQDPSGTGSGSANTGSTNIPPVDNPKGSYYKGDDYLDTVSVFGGVNKIILSKSFKGGEIVNIFGGAELDFTQADIQGRVIIDITQIFGGTKIIVPSNWQVIADMAAVFASVDDKRIRSTASPDNTKILVIKGVSIFAGVDVRSY
jgi:predicted membrane protein